MDCDPTVHTHIYTKIMACNLKIKKMHIRRQGENRLLALISATQLRSQFTGFMKLHKHLNPDKYFVSYVNIHNEKNLFTIRNTMNGRGDACI